jgi:drug/metabolite transporter (DMT)-like permease
LSAARGPAVAAGFPIPGEADPRRLHRRALATLLLCTVLWSTAGVGTRFLEHAEGFEIAFWRCLFCAVVVAAVLVVRHRGGWIGRIAAGGLAAWASGAMWATMFVAFMLALSYASVANVLVVMAAAPLLAALLGWVVLGERVPPRTWVAIGIAAAGIVWMVREGLSTDGVTGMAIAFAVPVAAAVNIVVLKRAHASVDLVPAVLLGALIAIVVTLPFAWPLSASAGDLAILAALGVFQLGLPCMLMVGATRHLAPHEIGLLGLLEVVLGPLWVWLGVGESPTASTLQGGALVLAALVLNELVGMRRPRR